MAFFVSHPGAGMLLDRLKLITDRARDLTPIVTPVVTILQAANRDRAMRGVDWQGHPYVHLAKRTLDDRARIGAPPGPPLNRRGLAAEVIVGCRIDVTASNWTIRFRKSFEAPWMTVHINGRGRVPQRNPLGFGDSEIQLVQDLIPGWTLSGVVQYTP